MDLSLLSITALLAACVDEDDPNAWEEFVARFHKTIAGTVYKMLLSYGSNSATLAEDLIQNTFMRLCTGRCRALRDFRAVEPEMFYGLVRAAAVNAVHDHFRHVRAVKRAPERKAIPIDSIVEGIAGPAVEEANCWDQLKLKKIDETLRKARGTDAERNRTIFWLHHRDGFSAAEISRLPGVDLTPKGVEAILRRLGKDVLGEHGTSDGEGGS